MTNFWLKFLLSIKVVRILSDQFYISPPEECRQCHNHLWKFHKENEVTFKSIYIFFYSSYLVGKIRRSLTLVCISERINTLKMMLFPDEPPNKKQTKEGKNWNFTFFILKNEFYVQTSYQHTHTHSGIHYPTDNICNSHVHVQLATFSHFCCFFIQKNEKIKNKLKLCGKWFFFLPLLSYIFFFF